MKLNCLAEVEIAEQRVCVRLSFQRHKAELLIAGVILVYPEVWDQLKLFLTDAFETEFDIIAPVGGYEVDSI